MQIAVSSNSKPAAGGEENSSSSSNMRVQDECGKSNRGNFINLLEKIWNYQMAPRWIFFFFVIQTCLAILVMKYFVLEYFRAYHIFWIIIGNMAFTYLWLIVTGRMVLRLRTPQEVSDKTPFISLRTTGVFFLVSGILMCAGEHGLRTVALGDPNWNSVPFNIWASTTFVLGIFNFVLAFKTNANRFLTFLVMLSNAAGFMFGAIWITAEARFIQRSCWGNPMCIYSVEDNYPKMWISEHGAGKAIPFGSIASFNFIRTLPVFASIFLAGCVVLMLINAMIKISMTEDESICKITKKKSKKNYATALIGLGITLVSFLAIKCMCDANSLLYLRHMRELRLTILILTPLGLLGVATLNGRAPAWFRALLMAIAAATFVTAYSSLSSSNFFQNEDNLSFESVMDSNCMESSKNPRQDYTSPSISLSEYETTTKVIQANPNQACFYQNNGWLKNGVVCIDRSRVCDGTVDIVGPVEICSTVPNHNTHVRNSGIFFVDEMFCPGNGVYRMEATIKAVNWLSILLSLAMVLALAFTFKDDNEQDHKTPAEEHGQRERMAFLHVWDKFQGILFSKVSNEVVPAVQEDTPIIKKKLESPC